MRVELHWSLDVPGTQCILQIPSSITLIELEEFKTAVEIQLRAVHRSLLAERDHVTGQPESASSAGEESHGT